MKSIQSTSSLRSRVIGAGSWVFGGHLINLLIRLGSNLIMTRLLVPEMFGVMSIVFIIITGMTMMSDVGIRQYILYSQEGEEIETLNTAWVIQILRGLVLGSLVFLLALLLLTANMFQLFSATSTYAHPDLPYVLFVMALMPVLIGFESTKRIVLNRNIVMGRVVVVTIASQVAGIMVMILFALIQPSIWSLVYGSLSINLFRVLLTHFYLPGQRNSFSISRNALGKIVGFSKWIFFSSIAGFFINQADRLWLGGLVTAEVLGVYSIAYLLMFAVKSMIEKLSASVLLPALSHVARERPSDLSKVYYKSRLAIDLVAFTTVGFLLYSGPLLVSHLYDSRYHEAGHMLSLVSMVLLSSGFLLAGRCLVAMGHVKQRMFVTSTYAVILNTSIPVMFFFSGLEGVILALIVSPIVPILMYFYLMKKYSILNLGREFVATPLFLVGLFIGWVLDKSIILLS